MGSYPFAEEMDVRKEHAMTYLLPQLSELSDLIYDIHQAAILAPDGALSDTLDTFKSIAVDANSAQYILSQIQKEIPQ